MRPQISILSAIVVVAGLVIGAGIFKTPSLIAGLVAPDQIIWIWACAALLSLIGALCYVELITRFPNERGEMGFLTEAWGPRVAFVYGWAKTAVINPGAIAMLAFVLADYWSPLWSGPAWTAPLFAAALILALTGLNLWGLQFSARFQLILLGIEVALLVGLSIGALMLSGGDQVIPIESKTFSPSDVSWGAMGLAMIFALLTFGGWNEAAYLVQDIRGEKGSILWVLVLSLGLVTLVYMLVNMALLSLLGAPALAKSQAPISDLASVVTGGWGAGLVLVVVSASILTSINATMVVGARATIAAAEGWSRLSALANWSKNRGTPKRALWLQTFVCLALVVMASFSKGAFAALVEFTAPVYWGFLMLVGLSLLVLRRRNPTPNEPHDSKAFVLPLGPLLPLVFVLCCAYLTYSSLTYADSQGSAWISMAVLAVGILASVVIGRPVRPSVRVRP
jgi:amino acid transporter